jgi:hypothetical protein
VVFPKGWKKMGAYAIFCEFYGIREIYEIRENLGKNL